MATKEEIIKWLTRRIKDEERKHSKHDKNWHEIAARKIYKTYDIKLISKEPNKVINPSDYDY